MEESYFRTFLHGGCRVCGEIKQLCFMIVYSGRMVRAPEGFVCLHHALGTSPPQSLWNFSAAAISPRGWWDWKSRSHCSRSLPHLVLATLLLKSQRIVSSGWSPNHCIRYIIALLLPSTSSRQGLQIWYRKKYDCSCYHYIHVMISWPVWCEISCVYFGGPRVTTFIGAREQV